MNSLKNIQTLSKIGKVLSKIAFIFSVIGFFSGASGLISLALGKDALAVIGNIKVHGTILSDMGVNAANFAAALSGWMIVCAGEAVVAKFAEIYFKNELHAETPFTIIGAKELQRLGILAIAVSVFCNVAGVLVEGVISGFTDIENKVDFNIYSNIALGVGFIIVSLLCRCGAELSSTGVTTK